MKKNSIVKEYCKQYFGGRIIKNNQFIGEYACDIAGNYIAYRMGGKARRFESKRADLLDAFQSYLFSRGYDFTIEICEGLR